MKTAQFILKTGLLLTLTTGSSLFAQSKFSMKGQLGKDQNGTLLLQYPQGTIDRIDSTVVKNGMFELQGQIQEPLFGTMIFKPSNPAVRGQFRELFLDPTNISVESDSSILSAEIKGGPSQKDFLILLDRYKPIGKKGAELDKLMRKYKEEGNAEKGQEIAKEMSDLRLEKRKIQAAFIKEYPDSYVAFRLWLRNHPDYVGEFAKVESEFKAFSPRLRNSIEGKKMAVHLAHSKNLEAGKTAPDFKLEDISGNPVSLSSLKGKNVFLIFWHASFMPFESFSFAVNRISRQLKDENLTLLMVYFDTNMGKKDWKTILEESTLQASNIINVKDPKVLPSQDEENKSSLMKAYDLSTSTVPQNYLIGTDGKILMRDINMANNPVAEIKKALGK